MNSEGEQEDRSSVVRRAEHEGGFFCCRCAAAGIFILVAKDADFSDHLYWESDYLVLLQSGTQVGVF